MSVPLLVPLTICLQKLAPLFAGFVIISVDSPFMMTTGCAKRYVHNPPLLLPGVANNVSFVHRVGAR